MIARFESYVFTLALLWEDREKCVGLKSRVRRDLRRRLLQTLAGTHYTHIVTVRTYQGQRVHIIEENKETKWSHCIALFGSVHFHDYYFAQPGAGSDGGLP